MNLITENQKHNQYLSNLLFSLFAIFLLLITNNTLADSAKEQKIQKRAEYIVNHYKKFEYQIPMRDGIKLFTTVYIPMDAGSKNGKKYPILLMRTPYSAGPYGANRYKNTLAQTAEFEKEGFIFAFQDVRGTYMSEGKFVNMRPQCAYQSDCGSKVDDATDSYDTIDYLVKNIPNNNGKVGMYGSSYPGYYTSVATINAHKALKAVSPQAAIADWFFDDFHRNGAFVTPMAFLFFHSFDKPRPKPQAHKNARMQLPTPDGYEFFRNLGPLSNVNKDYFKGERPFWDQLMAHPNYDEFWQKRDLLQHLGNTKPATLLVGGWFDTEDLYGPLNSYQTMSKQNRRQHIKLVMGPWFHGQWYRNEGRKLGDVDFGFNTSEDFQRRIQLPFFKHHLKGDVAAKLATATMFETGANRWREFEQWPPKALAKKRYYLAANEKLTLKKPNTQQGYSDYISDPNKPVPSTNEINSGWSRPFMVEDQRFAARRTDVLVFDHQTQQQDLTLAGPIKVKLWVSTDKTDADFIIKLIDVHPGLDVNSNKADKVNGDKHQLVRWGVMRGRFRNDFSQPQPFKSGEPTLVEFTIEDVLHTIKRGHRLQIQVQSSFFPFLDRNPQTYVDNIFKAKAEDFVKAEHKIYHNAQHPSSIEFGVLNN